MPHREQILGLLDDPEGLESLYRQEPDAFRMGMTEALMERPESVVLRVWQARLSYGRPGLAAAWRSKLGSALAIILVFGLLLRVPAIWLDPEWFYPRFLPSFVMLAATTYFVIAGFDRRRLLLGLGFSLVVLVWVGALPSQVMEDGQLAFGDSVVMALLHAPILFWVFLGVVFTGDRWRQTDGRIRFVRYNGELVVLGSLVALGGIVFTLVTLALFELMADDVEEWYFRNVGIFGPVAIPVAGTYLYDVVFGRSTGIPAVLARIFAPLFLVMAVAYLAVAFLGGENPFIDRNVLITFNALLLVVLGITVFSIVERGEKSPVGLLDYVNVALVGVTLVIDAIALLAILFRLASFGFTPNRVVVLGANLVILAHLVLMSWAYLRLIRAQGGSVRMRETVANYLPVYAVWAAVVAFVLPLVFGFA